MVATWVLLKIFVISLCSLNCCLYNLFNIDNSNNNTLT